MRITWHIDPDDIERVQVFLESHRDSSLVRQRIVANLATNKPAITKDVFWHYMVFCLLTTQQRSGPTSSVARFFEINPFPLSYRVCRQDMDLAEFARTTISAFGGLRRSTIIGKEMVANLSFLNGDGWEHTCQYLDRVRLISSPEAEREAANFIDDHFKGFGPKQSRNLLQELGLSRYEIPIDSRITKWLNAFRFPLRLTAEALQDRNYYQFISDGFQRLSAACDVYPCVLDAAIFSSFDKEDWAEQIAYGG